MASKKSKKLCFEKQAHKKWHTQKTFSQAQVKFALVLQSPSKLVWVLKLQVLTTTVYSIKYVRPPKREEKNSINENDTKNGRKKGGATPFFGGRFHFIDTVTVIIKFYWAKLPPKKGGKREEKGRRILSKIVHIFLLPLWWLVLEDMGVSTK